MVLQQEKKLTDIEVKKIIQEDRANEIQKKCSVFWDSWKLKWRSTFATRTEQLKK